MWLFASFAQAIGNTGAAGPNEEEEWKQLSEKHKEALVIDENGVNLGILPMEDVYTKAKERNMKIVRVRDSEPPVLRFEERLSARDAREKAKKAKKLGAGDPDALHDRMKEVRLSDKITEHDLQVKVMKTTQHLLSRYRVKVLLSFKRRDEFDPQVAKALLDNVLLRLADICVVETAPKMSEERSCFVVIRPVSRKQLISMGHVEAPEAEGERTPSKRELSAEKHRLRELEKQELRDQGLVFKRFLSPTEQARLAQEASGGDNSDISRAKAPKRKAKGPVEEDEEDLDEDDFDEFSELPKGADRLVEEEDEDELVPGRR